MATKVLNTAVVPPQFLSTAMLVGSTPLKALGTDPRVSYCLYVPPEHYNPDPTRQTEDISHPSYKLPKIPLIVTVHGTGRDVASSRRRLISLAETERAAILAPLFPAGIDNEMDLDNYKSLRCKSLSSDIALLDMVDEVKTRYPGIDTDKFFLVGYSGGGQFVHRFLYIYPEKIYAASVGAPGRVTHLDSKLDWPQGIKNVTAVFGQHKAIDLESIKNIRAIQLVVGGEDVEVPSNEFHDWVKQTLSGGLRSSDRKYGSLEPMRTGRLETLKTFHEEWVALGIHSVFEVAEGIKHDSNGINQTVLGFLQPLLRNWWSSRNIEETT